MTLTREEREDSAPRYLPVSPKEWEERRALCATLSSLPWEKGGLSAPHGYVPQGVPQGVP